MNVSKEIKNNINIVRISGDTSIRAEQKLSEIIGKLSAKTNNKIILDLSNCTYIDSGAVGAIIIMNKTLISAGGKFCICGVCDENIDRLFNSTKLYMLVKKFENVDDAIAQYF